MTRNLVPALLVFSLSAAAPARATDAPATAQRAPSAQQGAERCAHGVAKPLCTRCNPKLAPAFKAKGDWCAEHERPESQCVLCHPELARKGVK